LSYPEICNQPSKDSSGGGTRTRNTLVNSQLLYQLSYPGMIEDAPHDGIRTRVSGRQPGALPLDDEGS
jgi:hypothetical protein